MRLMTALTSILLLTSCIYDAPGDRFYRTLWTSSEATFYTDIAPEIDTGVGSDIGSDVGITLEFLCGGSVKASAPGFAGSYGTYTPTGLTAIFEGLSLSRHTNGTPTVIIIEEAHRTNDFLTINWHYSGSEKSHTTALSRRSSY